MEVVDVRGHKEETHFTYAGVSDLCDLLVPYLVERRINALVAITRGGLVPTGILAHKLAIRNVQSVCIQSYTDTNEQKELKVVGPTPYCSVLDNIAFIDDIGDSGETARWVRNTYPMALMCVLIAKPASFEVIQLAATSAPQDRWVNFPWEKPFEISKRKGHDLTITTGNA